MYKSFYSRFLAAHPGQIHFACHSHHYWPDVTRLAQLEYWDDSCLHGDEKWDFFFREKVPRAQKLIASHLLLSRPDQILFAPNTHELSYRLLSCLDRSQPIHILTTDSEFYSFERQLNRFAENQNVQVTKVPTLPFATFQARFCAELNKQKWNLVFFSHVFFNSGWVCDFSAIAKAVQHAETLIAVDGYHGFMAVPTDLQELENRIFYLAGSYKYAQGGEGCCFMTVPSSSRQRPEYTGWFAELAKLSSRGSEVGYPQGALQFAGSTMDFTALYRLIACLELFRQEKITVDTIHGHIQFCQREFLARLDQLQHPWICRRTLLNHDLQHQGHFLTFELSENERCKKISHELKQLGILTDSRGSRLRFGFGLYHDGDYSKLSFTRPLAIVAE